eukprot:m51a1_g12348 hypothetical protein (671) ;mRNA; r:530970-534486
MRRVVLVALGSLVAAAALSQLALLVPASRQRPTAPPLPAPPKPGPPPAPPAPAAERPVPWRPLAGLAERAACAAPHLDALYDRAFVINLARRADRWSAARARLDAAGAANAERFAALEGDPRDPRFAALAAAHGARYAAAAAGCVRSHAAVARLALARGYARVLVLEDDAVLHADAAAYAARAVAGMPGGWRLLMLGANNQRCPVPVAPALMRVADATATHAYLASADALREIAEGAEAFGREIDVFFSRFAKAGQAYATWPLVAGQAPGFSDLHSAFVHYKSLSIGVEIAGNAWNCPDRGSRVGERDVLPRCRLGGRGDAAAPRVLFVTDRPRDQRPSDRAFSALWRATYRSALVAGRAIVHVSSSDYNASASLADNLRRLGGGSLSDYGVIFVRREAVDSAALGDLPPSAVIVSDNASDACAVLVLPDAAAVTGPQLSCTPGVRSHPVLRLPSPVVFSDEFFEPVSRKRGVSLVVVTTSQSPLSKDAAWADVPGTRRIILADEPSESPLLSDSRRQSRARAFRIASIVAIDSAYLASEDSVGAIANLSGSYKVTNPHCNNIDAKDVFDTSYTAVQVDADLTIAPTHSSYLPLKGTVSGTSLTVKSSLAVCSGNVLDGNRVSLSCVAPEDTSLSCTTTLVPCSGTSCDSSASAIAATGLLVLGAALLAL